MPTRVGIELSPVACRIVEIEGAPVWRRRVADTCVRSFARLTPASPQMRVKLASLRGRKVSVVVWGLPSDHRQIVGTKVSSAVQPLVDAGLAVRSVVTPALALTSLARLRRASAVPDATEAYVALEESATSFALVRDGGLVAAIDVPWGYADGPPVRRRPRPREEIAARLADQLVKFFGAAGAGRGSVAQVCICGGLPDLRSMTVPLMERLDLEVETLDSLFAIDVARLPDPAAEFRDRSAELRLAWAVAADWPTPINLLGEQKGRQRREVLARAAVVAGVAAGLGIGWSIERSAWWRSTESKPAALVTAPAARPSATRQAAPAAKPAPPLVVKTSPPPVPPPVAVPASPRERQPKPEPAPLPFDAVLGTILYAPGRTLAIIDGRIVQPGDDASGARVVEISPAAVLLRDKEGRLRLLALRVSGR